jgi:fermentation-respiration switch protein FrsA (DUF1100 family)
MKEKPRIDTALWIGLALLIGILFLAGCENRIIYYPYKFPEGYWNPEGAPVEDVAFRAEDGTALHGWYVPAENPRATLLWFHGNAGNITHRWDNLLRLRELGLNIFIFDYRGYGKSEGSPDEKGIALDSAAAYQWLVKEKGASPDRLFLFGRSLGGIFAAGVAEKQPMAGLILESTFTNAQDMAKKMFWAPVGFAIRSKLDALSKVPHLKMPKLFLHGTADTIVPYDLGRQLYEAAAEPKEFYDITGADHNDTYEVGGAPYFAALDAFITRTLEGHSSQEKR